MESTQLYRKGENPEVDKQFASYRSMRMYRGDALHKVLSDQEIKTMAKLWIKERLHFSKLTKEDVLRLVEFAKRVSKYREALKKEKGRQRMERSRKKLREAAEDGDSLAIKKLKKNEKAARKVSANYYKRKRGRKAS